MYVHPLNLKTRNDLYGKFRERIRRIQEITCEWLNLFFESKRYEALNEVEKDNAGFAVQTFVDNMFNYEAVIKKSIAVIHILGIYN